MASTGWIEIGLNDSLQDVIRKCNQNFRTQFSAQSTKLNYGLRDEKNRSEAALSGAVGEINAALEQAKEELDSAIEAAIENANAAIASSVAAAKQEIQDYVDSQVKIVSDKVNDLGDPITIAHGGTGQKTVAAARNAFGLGNTSGALPVANGGTGSTTRQTALNALGVYYGTSAPASTNTNRKDTFYIQIL